MIYIGNTKNIIDWDSIVDSLKGQPPAHTGPDNSLADPDSIVGFQKILDQWNSVGVKTLTEGGTNNWNVYLPGKNFDNTVIEKFCDFVGADVTVAWIANIIPGCMAHWHWDTSGKEDVFDSIPNMVRYCCFIMKPQPGHVFMTNEYVFSYTSQGDVYEWADRKMWHGGVNFGFEEKYMFHFIGPKRCNV
jgi:hypothetical protein